MSLLTDARRVSFLPSLLTLGNFSCGFLSIVFCLNALYYDTLARASRMAEARLPVLAPEDGTIRHAILKLGVTKSFVNLGYISTFGR